MWLKDSALYHIIMIEGKIYMIKSKNTDKVYIGSTKKRLSKRLGEHKADMKRYKKGNIRKYSSSFHVLEHGDFYIELIREIAVENKTKLHEIEGETINLYRTLGYNVINENLAGRKHKESMKACYEKHKEEIKARREQKFLCECGGCYTYAGKAQHNKTKKHLSFII